MVCASMILHVLLKEFQLFIYMVKISKESKSVIHLLKSNEK